MWIFEMFIDLQISPLRCSRAFLRILSKHGAWGLDQTSQQCTEVLCLYSVVFISNRRVFIAQSCYCLINSYPVSGVQIVESATLHYLKAWNRLWSTLVFFYHSHRFLQRLPSVFTTHHSPLTIKTPWEEHFQHLPILPVRFLVPQPPPPHLLSSSLPSQSQM